MYISLNVGNEFMHGINNLSGKEFYIFACNLRKKLFEVMQISLLKPVSTTNASVTVDTSATNRYRFIIIVQISIIYRLHTSHPPSAYYLRTNSEHISTKSSDNLATNFCPVIVISHNKFCNNAI